MGDVFAINEYLPVARFLQPGDQAQMVVLPQPEGPSSVTICPRGMVSAMLSITVLLPNRLETLRSSTKFFWLIMGSITPGFGF